MAVKEVLRMGHPILRMQAEEVDPTQIQSKEMEQLVQDMFDTMSEQEGIGLAAPQIGVSKQIAIVGIPQEDEEEFEAIVVINPKISILDQEVQGFWEGCLSVPGLRGHVERPRKIQVDFLDLDGNQQSVVAEGFTATIFQHEIDHLWGKLYIDRISDTTKLSFIEEFAEYIDDESEGDE
jgi:peptide deformylase